MSMVGRDIYDVDVFSVEEVYRLFELTKHFKGILDRRVKKVPALRGVTVCTAFFENSTRTKISFDLAAKRLGADTVAFSASSSSLKKGESLKDTILTLDAMGIDLYVVRHSEPGTPQFIKKYTRAIVINAGDGFHAHPTQALLDNYTIWEKKGKIEGLRISIIGDIQHSRVVRSNIKLMKMLGAKVTVCGPKTLMPLDIEKSGVRVSYDINEGIDGADVVMGLRMQLERQTSGLFPTLEEYHKLYGITKERLTLAKPDVIFMHPGPMNRGVEVDDHVADFERSVVQEQVTNGEAARMALLYLVLGGRMDE
ncbi:aspartate carbamoyltransferase [Kosmotoga arenicorallina S304]|uniref:Aspartate carbamoyltransferase n=1 Tax=Kosmotoga arenicorallina S304 TaxID=1453497 RepID=A0A176K479_9BACT|nr:aspartate carbamoyltransferase catalytic subunit [Kosmotoga arenicorallina]OAA31832.1 aspartate carbamoyltransferase [Kosmotoga arenicorallina S304]